MICESYLYSEDYILVMSTAVDRDVKVFHALQKGRIWKAFVVLDIADKCADADSFKTTLNGLLQGRGYGPVEEYRGALFVRGEYDTETSALIRDKFSGLRGYQEREGDYFTFLSRYHFWNIIDSQLAARKK